MTPPNLRFPGLAGAAVQASRARHGWNKIETTKESRFKTLAKRASDEPMLMLLLAASILYLVHGDVAEAAFMFAAIVLIASISFYQESRSKKALEALRALTRPKSKVIRDSQVMEIPTEEIVVGDYIISEEGSVVAADGVIVQANDFTVNESTLTGESLPVAKDEATGDAAVYQGTFVLSGLSIARVTHVGSQTKIGQIGMRLQQLRPEPSPMQVQIANFVKKMAITGVFFFLLIWIIRIVRSGSVVEGLLEALTLAMSILPEEIPVAFATFMALGAWRLAQLGVIVKQARTVETLGSATVICVDKTGTLTRNEMSLDKVYVHARASVYGRDDADAIADVVALAMWASEPVPFDVMEVEIHRLYQATCKSDLRPGYTLVREYPLSGKPPLMTHVFQSADGATVIAAKGAPEAILRQSEVSASEREQIVGTVDALAGQGYRVLGVGQALAVDAYPPAQHAFRFAFKGLVAFRDPPKDNIRDVLQNFYDAGIEVKIITGDNPTTTAVIAKEIGLRGDSPAITGDQLMALPGEALAQTVRNTTIFARMFPEAKVKIIEALKQQGHIVAMTGDGINDGPALKAAHIGIAMGRKGSEIAKDASAIILADDNLAHMVEAVAMGRKIYGNLKKAIQYIISIHIPIILIVFIPTVLGWVYAPILTPIHVIFLELIMGPTCSIVYENEPLEKNAMQQRPRPASATFFYWKELSVSVLQGVAITAGLLFIYTYAVARGASAPQTTSMIFACLITANIFLTLVNRSFHYSMFQTFRYRNKLMPLVIALCAMLTILIFAIPAVRHFFSFEVVAFRHYAVCVATGALSAVWFEAVKFRSRRRSRRQAVVSPTPA